MKHLLSLEKLPKGDMETILKETVTFKRERGHHADLFLQGQTWAMIFSKSSTRTRVSFEVGLRELGAQVMFLNANEIQLGRGEPISDTARVLGRMCHGAVIRTFAQSDVEEFAQYSGIPTVNALTDDEHPCQVLTDIATYQELRGSLLKRVVTFYGDGACNVANSWLFAAAKLEFELRIAAPTAYQPSPRFLERLGAIPATATRLPPGTQAFDLPSGSRLVLATDKEWASKGADLLYTDVWVSMGKEAESASRIQELTPYQLDQAVVKIANPDALVMHCLPAYRGKEISAETFEANADTIFTESENRLHTQKAILRWATR